MVLHGADGKEYKVHLPTGGFQPTAISILQIWKFPLFYSLDPIAVRTE